MKYFLVSVWVNRMRFLDSHFHLMAEEFDKDREVVLQRALNQGVKDLMVITLDNEETKKAIEFNQAHGNPFLIAAGIFPEDLEKNNEIYWQEFCDLCAKPEISAIGEIGLEYHWVSDPELREKQKLLFAKQIELSKALNKPYLVHSRDAIQDTFDIMKAHGGRGLVHCFPGSPEMAKEFNKFGFYLAIGGALTFKNAKHAPEVVRGMDIRYLLSETDAPYMTPVPHRGHRNEPSYIPYIVEKMAELRGISKEEMTAQIQQNWLNFFTKK
ncbi:MULTISPECIES: TatD family hydrolase [Terrabacteria group]|uniref:TatD family hydrolase n=1 Tax=Bacillati TaxID=1783272 RepID=UPI001C6EFF82|nr:MULTISPECIES: TatD family hydrolase [Terrabacteria group]MBW9212474.1 TatD family hydrolase [Trueperella sp. zg.1013]